MSYGLIGNPLSHSFSADFFNEKFKRERMPETYSLFPLNSIEEIPILLSNHPSLKGLNVTLPFKEMVLPFLDEISPEAREIGAVNVIRIFHNGDKIKLKGFNSDWIAFRDSLEPLLRDQDRNALILGTGGAAKAVAFALKSLDIKHHYVSRNPKDNYFSYDDLKYLDLSDFPVVINATPLGMFPETEKCPSIPYDGLSQKHLCYDLIYNPDKTLFLKKAEDAGARIKNGLEMLHRQALKSWEYWNQ